MIMMIVVFKEWQCDSDNDSNVSITSGHRVMTLSSRFADIILSLSSRFWYVLITIYNGVATYYVNM